MPSVERYGVTTPPASAPAAEISLQVTAKTEAALVQVRAMRFAAQADFGSRDQARIAIVVSELATNIIKYAREGLIRLRWFEGPASFLEIEAIDHGPGIADVPGALRDGTTEGVRRCADDQPTRLRGLGEGLGGIRRLMDRMEIRSDPNRGTRIRTIKARPSAPGYRPASAPPPKAST